MPDVEIRLKKGVPETVEVPRRVDGKIVYGSDNKPVMDKVTRPKTQVVPDNVANAAVTAKGAIYEIVTKARPESVEIADVAAPADPKVVSAQVKAIVTELLPELLAKILPDALPAIPTPDDIKALIDAKLAPAEAENAPADKAAKDA